MEAIIHNSTLEASGMNVATLNSVSLSSLAPGIFQKEMTANFQDASGCVIQTKDGLTFQTKENEIH